MEQLGTSSHRIEPADDLRWPPSTPLRRQPAFGPEPLRERTLLRRLLAADEIEAVYAVPHGPCVVKEHMTKREASRQSDWPDCGTNGFIGIRVEGHRACAAHVDWQASKTIRAVLKPDADLDLRGIFIDLEPPLQVIAALRSEDGPSILKDVSFCRPQLTEDALNSGAPLAARRAG